MKLLKSCTACRANATRFGAGFDSKMTKYVGKLCRGRQRRTALMTLRTPGGPPHLYAWLSPCLATQMQWIQSWHELNEAGTACQAAAVASAQQVLQECSAVGSADLRRAAQILVHTPGQATQPPDVLAEVRDQLAMLHTATASLSAGGDASAELREAVVGQAWCELQAELQQSAQHLAAAASAVADDFSAARRAIAAARHEGRSEGASAVGASTEQLSDWPSVLDAVEQLGPCPDDRVYVRVVDDIRAEYTRASDALQAEHSGWASWLTAHQAHPAHGVLPSAVFEKWRALARVASAASRSEQGGHRVGRQGGAAPAPQAQRLAQLLPGTTLGQLQLQAEWAQRRTQHLRRVHDIHAAWRRRYAALFDAAGSQFEQARQAAAEAAAASAEADAAAAARAALKAKLAKLRGAAAEQHQLAREREAAAAEAAAQEAAAAQAEHDARAASQAQAVREWKEAQAAAAAAAEEQRLAAAAVAQAEAAAAAAEAAPRVAARQAAVLEKACERERAAAAAAEAAAQRAAALEALKAAAPYAERLADIAATRNPERAQGHTAASMISQHLGTAQAAWVAAGGHDQRAAAMPTAPPEGMTDQEAAAAGYMPASLAQARAAGAAGWLWASGQRGVADAQHFSDMRAKLMAALGAAGMLNTESGRAAVAAVGSRAGHALTSTVQLG